MKTTKNSEDFKTIIMFLTAYASIIDDELSFFKIALDKFFESNGKKYKGQKLEVFAIVQADFSSGTDLFYVENDEARESTEVEYGKLLEKFKEKNLKTVTEIKNTKEFEVYHLDM